MTEERAAVVLIPAMPFRPALLRFPSSRVRVSTLRAAIAIA